MATTLTIGGKAREFRFDFQALRLAERHMTSAVMEILGLHSGLFTLDQLAALCYGAWARAERGLTFEKTQARLERWMTDEAGNLYVLHKAVVEALVDSGLLRPKAVVEAEVPDPEDLSGRPTPPPPPPDPSGSPS